MEIRNSSIRVGIKFCGHCNPRKDMQSVAAELINKGKRYEFVYWSYEKDVDILVILNACEAGCAERPAYEGAIINVTPETINYCQVKEDLCNMILQKISEYLVWA